jgi:glycosyltransferase involved in cell wall biosynthesis
MRILQIIDSLDIGGAERMAVNYANALSSRIEFSGLVATRKEGDLKYHLQKEVAYFFLNRKSTFDFNAILRLKSICKSNRITHVQAHTSSFFTAFLLKLITPQVTIIWHDHYGLSEFLSTRKSFVIKLTSFFFKGIIAVNSKLKEWAEKELHCKNVIYLANFTSIDNSSIKETALHGIEGKRILCLANLRFQKNHFLLLEIANKIKKKHPDWTFHLVGKDFGDDYAKQLKNKLGELVLQDHVFIYGSKNDTHNIISQSEIAILTSQSEGLPVALLEYGLHKKAVVSTDVGEIPTIIKTGSNGILVPNLNEAIFYESIVQLIENPFLRNTLGEALFHTITTNYTENAVTDRYCNWLNQLDGK